MSWYGLWKGVAVLCGLVVGTFVICMILADMNFEQEIAILGNYYVMIAIGVILFPLLAFCTYVAETTQYHILTFFTCIPIGCVIAITIATVFHAEIEAIGAAVIITLVEGVLLLLSFGQKTVSKTRPDPRTHRY